MQKGGGAGDNTLSSGTEKGEGRLEGAELVLSSQTADLSLKLHIFN